MITKQQNLTFSGLIQNGVKNQVLKLQNGIKSCVFYKPKIKLEKKA